MRGITGLTTILVFLAALISAVIAALFIINTSEAWVQRPLLMIEGQPIIVYISSEKQWYLKMTVRNAGTSPCHLKEVVITNGKTWSVVKTLSEAIEPGDVASLNVALGDISKSIAGIYRLSGVLRSDAGENIFTVIVLGD